FLLVRQRKGMDQRAHAIGIGERERTMAGERLDAIERGRFRNRRLQREPFVDNQRIVGVAGVEIVERDRALGHVAERQRRKRRHPVGHIVGGLVLAGGGGKGLRARGWAQKNAASD